MKTNQKKKFIIFPFIPLDEKIKENEKTNDFIENVNMAKLTFYSIFVMYNILGISSIAIKLFTEKEFYGYFGSSIYMTIGVLFYIIGRKITLKTFEYEH